MDLKKVMLVIAFIGILGIPAILWFYFDYTDYSWKANSTNYIYLFVCATLIFNGINNYIKYGKPEQSEK